MRTFWLDMNKTKSSSEVSQDKADLPTPSVSPEALSKFQRLVDWNTEVLTALLQQIVASRVGTPNTKTNTSNNLKWQSGTVIDEVKEIIELPPFQHTKALGINKKMELDSNVQDQLREYVSVIASLYRSNHFHNFEHASHVTMSANKLMSRIVAPEIKEGSAMDSCDHHKMLHDHTYGITSDPLTQFAVVFSALVHDVDQ